MPVDIDMSHVLKKYTHVANSEAVFCTVVHFLYVEEEE